MKKQKRILYYSEGWGLGGIERFVMNTVEMLDPNEYQFDIFCTHDWSNSYDATIEELGGRRYTVFKGFKPNLITRLRASIKAWAKLLKDNHYDVVHVNTMNGVGFVYAHLARKYGVPVRVVHSHNSAFGSGHTKIKAIAHNLGIKFYANDATCNLACSKEAGHYLFGRAPFEIVPNGINIEAFAFCESDRNSVRKSLNLTDDAIVFGSVGRLSDAKNPMFQIEVLAELRKRHINAYLMLIGEGELQSKIVQYAEELVVRDYLYTPGGVKKPQSYLSALDVLSMPSKFEGFPMSLIEAVDNGLQCVVSDSVKLDENLFPIKFLPISSASRWADTIQDSWQNTNDQTRKRGPLIIEKAGYDRKSTFRQLIKSYTSV